MKRVYSAHSVTMAWHIKNVLTQHDIDATVENDQLYSIAGETPFTECMPEVWVKNRLDFSRAERIIRELETSTESDGPDWICSNCDENNAPIFAICWNCQQASTRENE